MRLPAKNLPVTVLCLALLLSAAVLGGAPGCAQRAVDKEQVSRDEKIVLKFSHVVAENTPKGLAARRFADLVNARTDGRVEVQVFPNAQLYTDGEELAALQSGAIQLIAPATSKLSELFPQWQVFDLPYAFPDEKAVARAMDGEIGRKLFTTLKSKNMLGLAMWDNGFKQMTNDRRPLIMPTDFQGLTFRVMQSRLLEEQFKAVGAVPVPMAFSEVYAAFENKVTDGGENTASNIYSKKFHEVQKYMTVSHHGYLGYAVVTNARFWESLPPDIRQILEEAMAETTAWVRENAAKINATDLERIKASGKVEIHVQTEPEKRAWMKAMDPVYDQFEAQIGKDLVDAVRALRG